MDPPVLCRLANLQNTLLSDFSGGKEYAVLLELSKGQEGQLPNIRTILASILTVPRYLRAQPAWYTSTASRFGRPGSG